MFRERNDLAGTQLNILMEVAGEVVLRLDAQGVVLSASSRSGESMGAYAIRPGASLFDLVASHDRHAMEACLHKAIETRLPAHVNLPFLTQKGPLQLDLQMIAYEAAAGKVELLLAGRDISVQRATEERLLHMSTHDGLTGLPNRSLLSDRLRMEIEQAQRAEHGFAVISLDLDGFKKVNDALGYAVGNALLRVAGDRLRRLLRDVDTLARVGGDEFVAVLPKTNGDAEIQHVARRMISSMQLPFEIDGHALYVSTSIGAAIYPEHGDTETKLLSHADTAMCRAKETGKARCVIYSELAGAVEHDVSVEAAMFEAVRNGEFLLHYQPIVDAKTRQIMGFEALMRWMRPNVGLVSPVQFIPMAEDNGLINLLGSWVLKAACVQLKKFEEVVGRQLYVSVNVSPRQFRNDQFLCILDDAIKLSGLQGHQLMLEITEGILMSDPEYAETLLSRIVSRGVRIAIDDFGTGYSSLVYLKRFPISVLKIDRIFIKDLPESVKDVAICNVVLSLASHLNLMTVAEGVENDQQLDFLTAQGCSLIQGFHTGWPLLPEAIVELLATEVDVVAH